MSNPLTTEAKVKTAAGPQNVKTTQSSAASIPAERMKAGRPHRVPLSDAAIALLKALPVFAGTNLVFPCMSGDKPLSDMSLTYFVVKPIVRPCVQRNRDTIPHSVTLQEEEPDIVTLDLAG